VPETAIKRFVTGGDLSGAEHGASKQEILDLKWDDIDFDFEGGPHPFFRTKTGRERTEYLMPRTKQALLEWRKHQDWIRHRKRKKDKGPGFVFLKVDGRRLAVSIGLGGGLARSRVFPVFTFTISVTLFAPT